MSLTQTQIDNIQIDYGIVYLNFGVAGELKLGATRGGAQFKVTPKIRDLEFDGSNGKTKGAQLLDSMEASLSITSLNLSMDYLNLQAPYATYASSIINGKNVNIGIIPNSAYLTNVTMFAKTGLGYKKITLYNAMSEGAIDFTAKPKAEGELKMEFFAHWDILDDTKDLFKIEDVATMGADVTVPTVITTPADAAIAVVVSANLTAVFNEDIRQSDINNNNFILIKASDGTIITGALTYTLATKTALFDPTANLTAATAYIWTIANVRDSAGNVLATTVVNFTTA